ncbi:hypothetical protein Hdeb2414_s0025g00666671 [Helianthus debilis subsp. tardiflorus]
MPIQFIPLSLQPLRLYFSTPPTSLKSNLIDTKLQSIRQTIGKSSKLDFNLFNGACLQFEFGIKEMILLWWRTHLLILKLSVWKCLIPVRRLLWTLEWLDLA